MRGVADVRSQLLGRAAAAGVPCTTLRIGQISGAAETGYWSTAEWVAAMLKSSVALGALPGLDGVSGPLLTHLYALLTLVYVSRTSHGFRLAASPPPSSTCSCLTSLRPRFSTSSTPIPCRGTQSSQPSTLARVRPSLLCPTPSGSPSSRPSRDAPPKTI